MIFKIQNEQPFQVLSTNFTIGASNEGYTLMFSADGNQYTPLFSVGAGIERMVTSVSNGAFYYLSGNASEVSINWQKECHSGGGGGGDINNAGNESTPVYTNGGKAIACSTSTDGKRWGTVPRVRDTDGVMEVGKYIDFHTTPDGTTDYDGRLSVSSKDNALYFKNENGEKKVLLAGDNAGDYNIVDNLPTNTNGRARLMALADEPAPTQLKEGQMAWLNTKYAEAEATTVTVLQHTEWEEWKPILSLKRKSDDAIVSGGDFAYYWNEGDVPVFSPLDPQGKWIMGQGWTEDGQECNFHYLYTLGAESFSFCLDSDEFYAVWETESIGSLFTVEEGTVTYKAREGAQYIYSNEFGWKRNIYELNSMTVEELINLVWEVKKFQDEGKAFPYPITFMHDGVAYKASNVSYDGNEFGGQVIAWSISPRGKHIGVEVDGTYGTINTRETGGDACNYQIVTDLEDILDEDKKDGLRAYVREQIIGGFWEGIRVNPKSADGEILWVDRWETICYRPDDGVYYFESSGESIQDNDIHIFQMPNPWGTGMNHGAYKVDESNRFILVTDDWSNTNYELRNGATGKPEQLEVSFKKGGESYILRFEDGTLVWKTFPENGGSEGGDGTTVLFEGQSDGNVNAYNKFAELQFDREAMAKYIDSIIVAWGAEYLKPLNTTFQNDIAAFTVIVNGTIQTIQLQMDGTLNLNS